MTDSPTPRCLVVDDDPGMCLLARESLLLIGGEVVEAHTAAEAGVVLSEVSFQMVVSDRKLQDRIGTVVLAQAAREQPNAALFLMSAHVDDDVRAEARAVGAVAVDKMDMSPLLERWADLVGSDATRWWEDGDTAT